MLFLLALIANGFNITYDHRALKIDGQRKLLISGSIHYPRSTPQMWPSILAKAKANGLDVVETYLFWDVHEPVKGQYDFSGNLDIIRFFTEVQKAGMYVNLRIGPYVCAEWNFGGFPVWLREIPGIVFRTTNEPYQREMKAWVDFVVAMIKKAGLFAPQGGPIIMAQIENEYGNVEGAYGEGGKEYVKWCASYAKSLDLGVPWIMCQQGDAPVGIINTCNGFYCDGFKTNQPDTPVFFTENWPGWFQGWGEAIPTRPAQDVAFSMARFYARGGAYANYYMWHGGTSFARTVGGPWIVTSYDYDVHLDEYGLEQNPKYTHSQQLHNLLHKYESLIINRDVPAAILLGNNMEAHVYGSGDNCVAFLSSWDTQDHTVTFQSKSYPLPAWSVTILDKCVNPVYNTAQVTAQQTVNEMVPVATALLEESGDADAWVYESWSDIPGVWGNATDNATPLEQLITTHDKSDYLWYVTNFSSDSARTVSLKADDVQDLSHVFVNNKYHSTHRGSIDTSIPLNAGRNTLQLVVLTMGLQNYGDFLEKVTKGLKSKVILDGKIDLTANGWKHQVGTRGENLRVWTPEGASKVTWGASKPNTPWTWYRTKFDVPSGDAPLALDLASMGKGYVYVNGHNLGRYWSIINGRRSDHGLISGPPAATPNHARYTDEYGGPYKALKSGSGDCDVCDYRGAYGNERCRQGCDDYSQRWYHLPREWTVPTGNVLVLFEEIGGNPADITLVQRQKNVVCGSVGENYLKTTLTVVLECSAGQSISKIDFAQYGDPVGSCRRYTYGTCGAANSTSVVEAYCKGKPSCSIPVDAKTFGDPCPGVGKRLSVQVTCA